MKKISLLFVLLVSFISLQAQYVAISGNKFYVGDKEIWFNGINTPWHLFDDFGRSDFNQIWWEDEFEKYVANKINLARVWIHGSGEVSPTILEDGTVTGASDLFWQHMDILFEISRNDKVYIMPCLFSFDMTKNTYPTYQRYRNMLADPVKVQSYIDNVLIPLVKRYDGEPYLLSWEICNEPEWMFENTEHGPQTLANVQRLHAMCAAAIHKNCSNYVTTGSAAPKWNSPIYDSWGDREGNCWSDEALQAVNNDSQAFLDFYQYHWYAWQTEWLSSPFLSTTQYYQVDDRPVIVGESEGNAVCDNYICQTVSEMYENAYLNGFDGVCAWKTPQNDGHGTLENIAVATNAFYNNHPALVYPQSTVIVPVTGVTVSPTSATVNIAATTSLKATVAPTNATNKAVSWTSSNTAVATVSTSGLVTGISTGSATITVTTADGSFKATSAITVVSAPSPCDSPISVALPLTQNGIGEYCWSTSGTISYINSWNLDMLEINGVDITNKWTNSLPAKVNGLYYIHYKASLGWGHMEINGTGGSNTNVPVTGVSVTPTSVSINVGSSATLTATIAPTDATNKSVTWSSSNTAIASVSTAGVVTGVAAGTTAITVTTVDGAKSATSSVTVTSTTIPVTGVTVSPTTASVNVGSTTTLTATVAPTNATNKSVTWSSSNTAIATVNTAGVVTGVAAGSATITVTTVSGGFTATSAITVSTTNVPVTGVTVSPTTASVNVGSTTTLTATVAPTNATNKSVTWSSSNTAIATVNTAGVVTGVAAGSATITVTTASGGFTASSVITVTSTGTPCSNPVAITIPFSQNGVGDFCFVTSQAMAYVNSWNMSLVEINGVDFTNVWSNNMPAAIDGKWYIHYVGPYSWSHFEAPALKDAEEISEPVGELVIYPNPFSSVINIELNGAKEVQKIELFNSLGQLMKTIGKDQINKNLINMNVDYTGNLFILVIHSENQVFVRQIVRQ